MTKLRDVKECSGTELLSEFFELRALRDQIAECRSLRLKIETHGMHGRRSFTHAAHGYWVLIRRGTVRTVDVPSPEEDARWAALCAEIDRRLAP